MSITPEQLAKLPKWAKAERERLLRGAALRWPTETRPTPINLDSEEAGYNGLWVGWFANGYGSSIGRGYEVSKGCSSAAFHSRTRTDTAESQGRGVMYRTKREALIEARWQLRERFAANLALVDAELEEESQQPPL